MNFYRTSFLLFLFVLAGDLVGILTGEPLLRYIFKPLIVPVVALHFLLGSRNIRNIIRNLVFAALFFSWAGDILLMFESRGSGFFMAGLGSFLVAHIFYILGFRKLHVSEGKPPGYWLILPVAAYYALLITVLSPHLGELEWPVRIYGFVICLMLLLALQIYSRLPGLATRKLAAGALLFVISDSLLAFNKFYQPFEAAGLLVMLTYAFAQWMIVEGVQGTVNREQRTVNSEQSSENNEW